MENNTKIAIGLTAAVVIGYIVYKKSKTPAQKNTTDRLICPNGLKYGMRVVGGVVGITGGCKDANGNWTNESPILNPDYVQTYDDTPEQQQAFHDMIARINANCPAGTFC